VRDVVGQFISVVGPAGKMLSQQNGRFFDPKDDSLRELGPAEVFNHRIPHFLPEDVAALFMNSTVANDGEPGCARSDENKDTIPFARFLHSEAVESCLSGCDGLIDRFAADEYPDFTGSLPFR
jgi:hypothetical protein